MESHERHARIALLAKAAEDMRKRNAQAWLNNSFSSTGREILDMDDSVAISGEKADMRANCQDP